MPVWDVCAMQLVKWSVIVFFVAFGGTVEQATDWMTRKHFN